MWAKQYEAKQTRVLIVNITQLKSFFSRMSVLVKLENPDGPARRVLGGGEGLTLLLLTLRWCGGNHKPLKSCCLSLPLPPHPTPPPWLTWSWARGVGPGRGSQVSAAASGRGVDRLALDLDVGLLRGAGRGPRAHPLLDLGCHGHEGLLHVGGALGARLQEGDSQVVGEFLEERAQHAVRQSGRLTREQRSQKRDERLPQPICSASCWPQTFPSWPRNPRVCPPHHSGVLP